jgi:hypothetical protein
MNSIEKTTRSNLSECANFVFGLLLNKYFINFLMVSGVTLKIDVGSPNSFQRIVSFSLIDFKKTDNKIRYANATAKQAAKI